MSVPHRCLAFALLWGVIDSISGDWALIELSSGTMCSAHVSWIYGELVEGATVRVEKCEETE